MNFHVPRGTPFTIKPLSPNHRARVLDVPGYCQILLSYRVPVVMKITNEVDTTYYVTDLRRRWSVTTSRHIESWVTYDARKQIISQEALDYITQGITGYCRPEDPRFERWYNRSTGFNARYQYPSPDEHTYEGLRSGGPMFIPVYRRRRQ